MSDDSHPRSWYKRKRYYAFATLAIFFFVIAAICTPPLLQPMGKPGRFDDELGKAIALVQPRTGNDAWPIIERLAKVNAQVTDEEVVRREAEPDYTPVQGRLYPYYDALFVPEGVPQQHPDDAEAAIVARRVLERLDAQDFWKEFDALADCGYSAPPRPRAVPLMTIDDVGTEMRALCRLLMARMKIAIRAGEQEEAVACLRRCLDLARLMPPDYGVISPLVRVAIQNAALNALRDECAAGRLGADTLRACDEVLAGVERLSAKHYLTAEHVRALDMMELMYTDDGKGDGYLNANAIPLGVVAGAPLPPPRRAGTLVGVFTDSKAQSRDKYAEFISRFSADIASDEPAPTIISRNKIALDKLHSLRSVYLGITLPALGMTVSVARHVEMALDGTRVAVALERYHADHACYPTNLDALAPTYLDKVPIDRFTMKPFGYLPERSDRPSHAILYSLGYDLKDNAGRESNKQSALSADASPDTDFILARLRPSPPTAPITLPPGQ